MKNIVRYTLMLLICGYGVVANAQQTLTVGDVRLYSGTTDWRYYAVTCTSDRPITSITISMINNEIPNTPATPTNSLMKESKSRLYDPRTFVYTFGNPITATQVVNFIKSITFRKEPNRHPGATPYVNITIDSNPTSLPNGATVTAWNAHPDGTTHYYVWVTAKSNEKTYKHAYDAAKLYYFQGMRGYLPTITSEDENKTLKEISQDQGWSAGARTPDPIADNRSIGGNPSMVNSYHVPYNETTAQDNPANYFRWICGPETGFAYTYLSPDNNTTVPAGDTYRRVMNGAFVDWVTGEPNNADAANGGENVMEVNYTNQQWNDYYSTNSSILGYFIEFGGDGLPYSVTTENVGTANYPSNPNYHIPTTDMPTNHDYWPGFSPGGRSNTATTFKVNMQSNVLVIE